MTFQCIACQCLKNSRDESEACRRLLVILSFCHSLLQRISKRIMNSKEIERRHGAKFICNVDKRHCSNECEVKRLLEREANETQRECKMYPFHLGVCSCSNTHKKGCYDKLPVPSSLLLPLSSPLPSFISLRFFCSLSPAPFTEEIRNYHTKNR